MTKNFYRYLLQFIWFVLFPLTVSGQTYNLGDTLTFWTYDYGFFSGYYQTNATCQAISEHLYIFVEDTAWNSDWVSNTEINQIIDAFENSTPAADSAAPGIEGMTDGIYHELTSVFGTPPDVDDDTHIFVLLLDMRDYWDDEDGSLNGLGNRVIDGDFWAFNESPGPRSMEREVIYIDTRRQSVEEMILALTHQFQRMLNWNLDQDEWHWVDEGLAMMAEYLVGYKNYQSLGFKGFDRVNFAARQSLTGWSYQNPYFYFQQVYLFMMYLYEKYGGISTLQMIANEPANSVNGIQNVLSSLDCESNELGILFKDLAIAAIYSSWRSSSTPDHPNPRYSLENLIVGSITNYRSIYWGMNNQDNPPYFGELPSWSCAIYKGISRYSTELDSLLVFDGVNKTDFTLEVLWNKRTKPDTNSIVSTMVLDNNQEGNLRVDTLFNDYKSYSIVITAQSDYQDNRYVLYSDSLYIHLPPRYLSARVRSENSINLKWYPPWIYSTENTNTSGSESIKHNSLYEVNQQLYELLNSTLVGYNVYRSETSDGEFEFLYFTDVTEYVDTDIISDKTYYYVVTAVYDNPSGESEYSNVSSATATTEISSLFTAIGNYGTYGDPEVPNRYPSMEWPGGSGVHYLWEGRLWFGAIVGEEKWVSHADYGDYELHPPYGEDSLTVLGAGQLTYSTKYNDYTRGNSNPLGIDVIQHAKMWKRSECSVLSNTLKLDIKLINAIGIGPGTLNDFFVSWCFDADAGTGLDPTSPHIDDLVDYDGWDGEDSDSDELDIVENRDWNENGKLDGYDERGIPYGLEYVGSPSIQNPNYDPSKIHPDSYPDEFQVIDDGNGGYTIISRQMSYMYDGDDPTTPEYDTFENGNVPGFIGLRLLKSPVGNSVYSHMWWNWNSDPGSDIQKYDFMAATHPSCFGLHFMPHPFDIGAPEFDYRFLLTTGPIQSFEEGDTLEFTVAVVLGKGLEGVRINSDSIASYYAQLAPTSIDDVGENIPIRFQLSQNYPNPFNPRTTICYQIPETAPVRLIVYNVLGEQIKILVNEVQAPDSYTMDWNGNNDIGKPVPSGIYFYRLEAG